MTDQSHLRFLLFLVPFLVGFSASGQADIRSFPVHEVKSADAPKSIIFYITGDGGWNSFSRDLCGSLSKTGFSIVALDAKKYFWDEKTPETFSSDLSMMISHYENKWKVGNWILVGYSFGADVAPFAPSRLNRKLISLPKACVLLSPSASTDFEIKLVDMLANTHPARKYDVLAEINKTNCPMLCVYAEKEKQTVPDPKETGVQVKMLPGDHRFNNDITALTQAIVSFIDSF
jgi:type IV secretory pathway VirJ component